MAICKTDVSFLVYILVILFAIISWIDINGIWVELPLLVQVLPEGWDLPSYMSVIIQVSNVGAIGYVIGHKCAPKVITERLGVFIIITVGIASLVLQYFFWDKTTVIGGSLHSTAFLALLFFLALVDCTSSVVFLPYMTLFAPKYLTALYIGEGLSGFLPAAVALIQGAGNVECVNQIINQSSSNASLVNVTEYEIVPVYHPPLFSVETFFLFVIAMMVVSGVAFVLLNYLPQCKKEHLDSSDRNLVTTCKYTKTYLYSNDSSEKQNIEEEINIGLKEKAFRDMVKAEKAEKKKLSTADYIYLLVLTAWINGLANAGLLAIQTYSTLPYGNNIYHLAVVLGNMANPAVCFLSFFVIARSKALISIFTFLGTAAGAYAVVLATMSPHPPLQFEFAGGVIAVIAWVLIMGFLTFAKVSIASVLRDEGRNALLWCGIVTQVGSAIASVVMFVLVNIMHLFQSGPTCPI